jgi:hypothetical protein
MRNLTSAIILLIILNGCDKEHAPDCLKRAGEMKSEDRTTGPFERIELRDYIQYDLVQSDGWHVEVEAPSNLLPGISTEVTDGRLLIRNRNTCNFVRSFRHRIHVRIHAPSFHHIENYATGDINVPAPLEDRYFRIENRNAAGLVTLRLDCDSADVLTHTGVCDVILRGTCDHIRLFGQGTGWMDASGLSAQTALVNNSSINFIRVRARDYLYAYTRFSGDIFSHGTPVQVEEKHEGSGTLHYVGD